MDTEVLDALDAGVMALDAEGVVLRVNRVGATILGRTQEQVLGCAIGDLVAPLATLCADRGHGLDGRREVAVKLPSGEEVILGLSVTSASGHYPARWVILFQSIAPLVELRRHRDRLLQLAAVGEVLPSVVHELRNPLAAVTTMVEVLVEDATGQLQRDLHAVLWEMRRMGLGMQGITGFTRSISSKRAVAIDHAVREVCCVLASMAEQKSVSIRCEVPALPLLPLDWAVVSGVVFNLVTNGIEACNAGNTITVTAHIEDARIFVLQVADDGCGMSAETLTRCRELFFTNKDSGSGIGLALCEQAASSAGGTLDIVSAAGAATTVTLRVPYASTERTTTAGDE